MTKCLHPNLNEVGIDNQKYGTVLYYSTTVTERVLFYFFCGFNSLSANWSVEVTKKESKKSCKSCHGVADLGQILFMISELSQLTDK